MNRDLGRGTSLHFLFLLSGEGRMSDDATECKSDVDENPEGELGNGRS
jgi:hypothetical protein